MGLLEVSGLEKSFGGVMAISGLSFTVPEGAIFSVIGPNGAGKTTLFNMITGIYSPDKGSVKMNGKEMVGLSPHQIAACGMSRTFQNLQVFLNMNVLENVMVGCHLRAKSNILSAILRLPSMRAEERQIKDWAMEALATCGLEKYAFNKADSLPYGVLKKLEIARALATRPKLLLLDEPAAGLNDTETLDMSSLIATIRDLGITVILVEHNMELVMGISDQVMVLNYGQLLAQGTPSEIQKDSKVISAYLGDG